MGNTHSVILHLSLCGGSNVCVTAVGYWYDFDGLSETIGFSLNLLGIFKLKRSCVCQFCIHCFG